MSKEQKFARWLQDKDGKVSLYRGADVEAALAQGLKEPTGLKPNGEPWNPEAVEGVMPQEELIVRHLDANAETNGKRAEKKAAELEKARKANEALAADLPETPDFKVQVIDPPAKPGAKKAGNR